MKFKDIVKKIKTLEIQGAENVAIEGAESLLLVLKHSKAVTREALVAELYHARDDLIKARPTEPCLRNALYYIFENIYSYDDEHSLYKGISTRIKEVSAFFHKSDEKISKYGASKIRHHSVVFTHCHSSTIVSILKYAKKQKKEFIVYNTETRPLWQGRKTAIELSEAGISIKHFVDSGAAIAMKDVHLCLFGCDAITEDKVYNKIGSGMFAELLKSRHIPLYICTNSWKYDPFVDKKHPEIVEERNFTEVWKGAPKKVEVEDPAFEAIPMKYISAFISELGILSPKPFLQEVKRKNKWMFRK